MLFRSIADQLDAMLATAVGIGIIFFYGIPITPLHARDLLAGVAAECLGEFVEFLGEPVASTPHSGIFSFLEVSSAVQGRNCSHCAEKCPAN